MSDVICYEERIKSMIESKKVVWEEAKKRHVTKLVYIKYTSFDNYKLK